MDDTVLPKPVVAAIITGAKVAPNVVFKSRAELKAPACSGSSTKVNKPPPAPIAVVLLSASFKDTPLVA